MNLRRNILIWIKNGRNAWIYFQGNLLFLDLFQKILVALSFMTLTYEEFLNKQRSAFYLRIKLKIIMVLEVTSLLYIIHNVNCESKCIDGEYFTIYGKGKILLY